MRLGVAKRVPTGLNLNILKSSEISKKNSGKILTKQIFIISFKHRLEEIFLSMLAFNQKCAPPFFFLFATEKKTKTSIKLRDHQRIKAKKKTSTLHFPKNFRLLQTTPPKKTRVCQNPQRFWGIFQSDENLRAWSFDLGPGTCEKRRVKSDDDPFFILGMNKKKGGNDWGI